MFSAFLFVMTTISVLLSARSCSASDEYSPSPGRSSYSDYLNKEYSPSMWSKRFLNGVDVVGAHVAFVTEEVVSGDAYSLIIDSLSEQIVTYLSAASIGITFSNPINAPIVVYIHGGYWQMMNKSMSAYCVKPLVTAGIKVIILGYDHCPTVTLTGLVEQVTKFGEYLLKFSDYAKSRHISLVGHSAGAHLILCMIDKLIGTMPGHLRINSIYLISGVYDLTELQYTNNNENNMLSINSANVNQLSPLKFNFTAWQTHSIEANIYVGQYDSPTFIRHSSELYLRLSDASNVHMQLIQDYDHFEIVEDLSLASYLITRHLIGTTSGSGILMDHSVVCRLFIAFMILFTLKT